MKMGTYALSAGTNQHLRPVVHARTAPVTPICISAGIAAHTCASIAVISQAAQVPDTVRKARLIIMSICKA